MDGGFVDIHCHLLPGVDDGADDWHTTLDMARMAVADGTHTIIVTPHQLGNFSSNTAGAIRSWTSQLQQVLSEHRIPLQVLPGGDARIEDGMVDRIVGDQVMTLADQGRHVLLELPHELYFPLEGLLAQLRQHGMVGVLSHPERNSGLLRQPELLHGLVDAGCLMQVTAGSLMGTFGDPSKQLGEWMLAEGLVHFLATDAHGTRSRRPLMGRAHQRVAGLTDRQTADDLCIHFPTLVACGGDGPGGRRSAKRRGSWRGLFSSKKVA